MGVSGQGPSGSLYCMVTGWILRHCKESQLLVKKLRALDCLKKHEKSLKDEKTGKISMARLGAIVKSDSLLGMESVDERTDSRNQGLVATAKKILRDVETTKQKMKSLLLQKTFSMQEIEEFIKRVESLSDYDVTFDLTTFNSIMKQHKAIEDNIDWNNSKSKKDALAAFQKLGVTSPTVDKLSSVVTKTFSWKREFSRIIVLSKSSSGASSATMQEALGLLDDECAPLAEKSQLQEMLSPCKECLQQIEDLQTSALSGSQQPKSILLLSKLEHSVKSLPFKLPTEATEYLSSVCSEALELLANIQSSYLGVGKFINMKAAISEHWPSVRRLRELLGKTNFFDFTNWLLIRANR
eukprot:GHVP01010976.1.p1 GENE.GHVP01010976.1~~GHVP01010976.1.p1  ORF type:complete len:366 (+),score=65.90 GHVP01010976.1:39-1100(+)